MSLGSGKSNTNAERLRALAEQLRALTDEEEEAWEALALEDDLLLDAMHWYPK